MQVLIVDDDESVRDAVSDLIRGWGYSSYSVEHGKAAIKYLSDPENPRPSLIILDGRMPVMTGEEFLVYREQDERLKSIPVVVFSGTAHELKCRTAQGYVSKPYISEVRPFVEQFCTRRAL